LLEFCLYNTVSPRWFIQLVGNGSYGRALVWRLMKQVLKRTSPSPSRADSRSAHQCMSMWGMAGVCCGESGVRAYLSAVSSCQPRSKTTGPLIKKEIEPLNSEVKEWPFSAQCAPDSPSSTFRHQTPRLDDPTSISREKHIEVPRR
jgi:hypothetical protein